MRKNDVAEKGTGPTQGGVFGVPVVPCGGGTAIGGEGMRGFQAESLKPFKEGNEGGLRHGGFWFFDFGG